MFARKGWETTELSFSEMRGEKGCDVMGTQGQANWSLSSDLTNYHSLTEYMALGKAFKAPEAQSAQPHTWG